jgi:3-carboxy-cis,cis-muconate cycloisomerase
VSYSFAISPLLLPIAGTEKSATLFSAEADLAAMLQFELALAAVQEEAGDIPRGTARQLRTAAKAIDLLPSSFAAAIAQDGMVVPELVRRLKAAVPRKAKDHVHLGSTSQDVIDTSLMLRAKETLLSVQSSAPRSSSWRGSTGNLANGHSWRARACSAPCP